jgi:uncharacterized protein with beta-barrel porin domain
VDVCDVGGATEVTISGDTPQPELNFLLSGTARIRNHGVFDLPSGSVALLLGADSLDYAGDGARFVIPSGTAINASSSGPGTDRFTLNEDILSRVGLEAASVLANIDIAVTSGTITASDNGIIAWTLDPSSAVDIAVAAGATIQSAVPVSITGTGPSSLVLGGRLEGAGSISMLGHGSSELELQPGYFVDGTVDGEGGTDTLVWGGTGTDSFDLASIGTKFVSFESFEKSGASAWTFEGAAPHVLNLKVNAGNLWLAPSARLLASDTATIAVDGRLGGVGTAGDLNIHGGLAPGLMAGTLYAGDVVFHPGSFLEIDSATDTLDVASVAGLDSATLRILPSAGAFDGWTILQSSSAISTTFATVETTSSRYLAAVDYQQNAILLSVTPTGKTYLEFARTPAEAKVAAQLDALGPDAPFHAQLGAMSDKDLQDVLAQLAGADLTSTSDSLIKASGGISTAALGRIQQQGSAIGATSPVMGYAAFDAGLLDPTPVGLWGRLVASTSIFGGRSAGATSLVGGADLEFGDERTLGLLFGVGGSAVVSGATTARTTGLTAGIYGEQGFGDTALRFVASASVSLVDSRRRVIGSGIDQTYAALYPAAGLHALLEVAHEFHLGPLSAELFGDLGYAGVAAAAYTEAGGPGALDVGATWNDAWETTVGARLRQEMAIGTVLATYGGSLAWTHRFAPPPRAMHSFAGSTPFEVVGQAGDGHSLRASFDLWLDLDARSGLDLSYALQWQPDGLGHSLSAKFARTL